MHAICEGAIEVTYPDPLTGEPTTGPLAPLMAEKLAEGLQPPAKEAHAYVETILEYGIGRPKAHAEASTKQKRQIPRIVFLSPPADPLAKPGDPPKPVGEYRGAAVTPSQRCPCPGVNWPPHDTTGQTR
jgi:hypothetical protein